MRRHQKNILLILMFVCLCGMSKSVLSQTAFFNGARYYLNKQIINAQGWPEFYPGIDSIKFDSLQNNREYYSYYHSDSHTVSKLYVENRMVFFQISDTGYTKIIDFNANKGDSMSFYMYQGGSLLTETKVRIDSVENTYIIGRPSKILYLRYNGYKYYNFIEHMGCARCGLPYWKNFIAKTSVNCVGMCFRDSGVKWQEEFGGDPGSVRRNLTCNDLNTMLEVQKPNELQSIRCYPNPAENWLFVHAKYELVNVTGSDLSGRVVLKKEVSGTHQTINFESLYPGTYIVSFQDVFNGISNVVFCKQQSP